MFAVEPGESVATIVPRRRRELFAGGAATVIIAAAFLGWIAWQHGLGITSNVTAVSRATVIGVVRAEPGALVTGTSNSTPTVPVRYAQLVVAGSTTAGTPIVRYVWADRRGLFRVDLPAGRYTVTATNGPPTAGVTEPHARITVTPGHAVHIHLTVTDL